MAFESTWEKASALNALLQGMIEKIEQIALGHFKFLPTLLGFKTHTYQGLHVINCGLGSSMFNIAFGCFNSDPATWTNEVQNIIREFKGQPFAWWIPPSQHSPLLNQYLSDAGFHIETTEHAMILDLESLEVTKPQTNLKIVQVQDIDHLEDFIKILEPYDKTSRRFYEKLHSFQLDSQEKLFLGYNWDSPAIIGILFEGETTSGIFSLLTTESERGKGFGTDMMQLLLNFSKNRGKSYVTLSASSDSGYRIYERLGFKSLGKFDCFEWLPGNEAL